MADSRSEPTPSRPRAGGGRGAANRVSDGISRVAEFVVPSVVRAVDVEEVVERIDLNRAAASVDLNAVVARVDLDAVLERVDLNAALERVDVNALVGRIDVNALAARLDMDALLEGVDMQALVQRVDVQSLAMRFNIGDLVAQSTSELAVGTVDLVRRECAGVDAVVSRIGTRLIGGNPDALPLAPPKFATSVTAGPGGHATPGALRRAITGHYAGALTRLLAFVVDMALAVALFTGGAVVLNYLVGLLTDHSIAPRNGSLLWSILLGAWTFLYFFVLLAVTGRTLGMRLLGLRVVARDGSALRARAAFLRVVGLGVSLVFIVVGFIGIIIGKERRGLADVIAGTVVVYDWGGRPAELPTPLSAWLVRHQAAPEPQPPAVAAGTSAMNALPTQPAAAPVPDGASPSDVAPTRGA
jgi:uncharacterized RDD family membrane protein YckC